MKSRSFRDLKVWGAAMELVKEVYRITGELPKEEKYALSSQIRRASISIPSNIAEGQRRKNRKEFIQFLYIADGSTAEVETQLILIQDMYAVDITVAVKLIDEIKRMLYGLTLKLKTKN